MDPCLACLQAPAHQRGDIYHLQEQVHLGAYGHVSPHEIWRIAAACPSFRASKQQQLLPSDGLADFCSLAGNVLCVSLRGALVCDTRSHTSTPSPGSLSLACAPSMSQSSPSNSQLCRPVSHSWPQQTMYSVKQSGICALIHTNLQSIY